MDIHNLFHYHSTPEETMHSNDDSTDKSTASLLRKIKKLENEKKELEIELKKIASIVKPYEKET